MHYQPQKNLLQNRIILVTGASDGIGREAALTYAEYGASVILTGRNEEKLKGVAQEIEAAGGFLLAGTRSICSPARPRHVRSLLTASAPITRARTAYCIMLACLAKFARWMNRIPRSGRRSCRSTSTDVFPDPCTPSFITQIGFGFTGVHLLQRRP